MRTDKRLDRILKDWNESDVSDKDIAWMVNATSAAHAFCEKPSPEMRKELEKAIGMKAAKEGAH